LRSSDTAYSEEFKIAGALPWSLNAPGGAAVAPRPQPFPATARTPDPGTPLRP